MPYQGIKNLFSFIFSHQIRCYRCGIEFLGDTSFTIQTDELVSENESVEDNMRMLAHRYQLTPEGGDVKYDVTIPIDYMGALSGVEEVTLVEDYQRLLGLPVTRLSLNLPDGTSVNVLKLEAAESVRTNESIFVAD